MPVKNIYHDTVIRALTADGWTNSHDPLSERFGQLVIARLQLRLLIFDDQQQRVVQWIG